MKFKKFNFKNVNSTNDIAIRLIKKTNNKFGVIVANKQKKGRGRFGRKWISYKGNLFVSLFFSLEKINLSLKQLTKVNCLLIKKLLSHYYKNKILIKPNNDLFVNKKNGQPLRDENVIIPSSSYVFQKDDTVVLLAKRNQLPIVENMFRISSV